MRIIFFVLRFIILAFNIPAKSQCNGYESLCIKKYNEVAYLTTHNAYCSFEDGFYLPNQNLNITSQLNHGVRAFMLDVYSDDNQLVLYHGTPKLGSSLLLDVLYEFKTFLNNNPNEVITLILEDYSSITQLTDVFYFSDMIELLYEHNESIGWLSLQEMIDFNQRLIVFSDQIVLNSPSWFHYIWDYAVETDYSNQSSNDFSCNFNRGNPLNDLFIFNHFITNFELVLGNIQLYNQQVQEINSNPYFLQRVYDCETDKNKFPNFITVDFFDIGDCLDVVNTMNQIPNIKINQIKAQNKIFPNPSRGSISLYLPDLNLELPIRITNIQGEEIIKDFSLEKTYDNVILNLYGINRGYYFLHIGDHVFPVLLID